MWSNSWAIANAVPPSTRPDRARPTHDLRLTNSGHRIDGAGLRSHACWSPMSTEAAATVPAVLTKRAIKRDVIATFVVFAANGAVLGSWTSRVPAIRDHLHAQFRVLG